MELKPKKIYPKLTQINQIMTIHDAINISYHFNLIHVAFFYFCCKFHMNFSCAHPRIAINHCHFLFVNENRPS